MAWTCSGRSNAELIENMAKMGLINSPRVSAAMKKVDRANYVLSKETAYDDSPQSIDYGATISAPHMHAHAAENLLAFLKPGAKVLDVGSGSGYTAAIFHHLLNDDHQAHDGGVVVGIDHVEQIVEWSKANLCRDGLEAKLQEGQIKLLAGDGRLGCEELGPFNAIHVGAAAPKLPEKLLEQLSKPGRMFIPVGTHVQEMIQVDKDETGKISEKRLFGVRYVPLTDRDMQM